MSYVLFCEGCQHPADRHSPQGEYTCQLCNEEQADAVCDMAQYELYQDACAELENQLTDLYEYFQVYRKALLTIANNDCSSPPMHAEEAMGLVSAMMQNRKRVAAGHSAPSDAVSER